MRIHLLVVLLLVFGIRPYANGDEPLPRFRFVENAEGVTILDGIRPVLTYQRATKSLDGKWPRANYVHPLYDLNGEIFTEDFPADHGHHRGIFWSWHQTLVGGKPMGDAWACEDFQWDVLDVAVQTTNDQAVVSTEVLWKSPALTDADGKMLPFVDEKVTITVHRKQQNVRFVDFEIKLLALVDDVKIGGSQDDKGYGGFSPRIKMPSDLLFMGTAGIVEPIVEQVDAGVWIDMSTANQGLAILTHQENPGFPGPWILRRRSSMQNAVFPGREPIAISRTKPLVLRYRLVQHNGALDPSAIDAFQQHYQTTD